MKFGSRVLVTFALVRGDAVQTVPYINIYSHGRYVTIPSIIPTALILLSDFRFITKFLVNFNTSP
jgi:hypothetical protein